MVEFNRGLCLRISTGEDSAGTGYYRRLRRVPVDSCHLSRNNRGSMRAVVVVLSRLLGDNRENGGREEVSLFPGSRVLTSGNLSVDEVAIGKTRAGTWTRPQRCQRPRLRRHCAIPLLSIIALW